MEEEEEGDTASRSRRASAALAGMRDREFDGRHARGRCPLCAGPMGPDDAMAARREDDHVDKYGRVCIRCREERARLFRDSMYKGYD